MKTLQENIISLEINQVESIPKVKVLAAIPCFNTASTIGQVVKNTLKYVDEVVVVDDGSVDQTAEVARVAGAKIITHATNQGYGAAIKSCFRVFNESTADILVTIDGDGQHNPKEINSLLQPILENKADMVIGSRFIEHLNMPRYRKFGIRVITFLWNFGSMVKVSDSQSGFRAYDKNIVQSLELTENGMSLSIEILEQIRKRHPVIEEIPISCSYDNNTSFSLHAFRHGMGVSLSVLKIRLKYLFYHEKNLV